MKPLESFGALIKSKDQKLPMNFKSSDIMKPIKYHSPIPSAQVKSSLILAALHIKGESVISEDVKTRDHTERLLKYMEYPILVDKETITLKGCKNIIAKDIEVPSDISSAAFFIVAALIIKGSDITLTNIGVNPLRTGIIDILLKMGANIKLTNCRTICNEPVADIKVKYSQLKPINISGDIISRLIDELPILFIACATCNGLSLIEDIHELRYKESDRIEAMENGLKKLGITIVSTENSMKITGGTFSGGIIDSYGDHRIAMSFLIAGLVSSKPITVLNTSNINTSFPNFEDILRNQKIDIYTSMSNVPIITIDGLASSGKTTISKLLSNHLGFYILDSGVLYRAFAYIKIIENIDTYTADIIARVIDNLEMVPKKDLGFSIIYNSNNITKNLYSEEIGLEASNISKNEDIRNVLLSIQHACVTSTRTNSKW